MPGEGQAETAHKSLEHKETMKKVCQQIFEIPQPWVKGKKGSGLNSGRGRGKSPMGWVPPLGSGVKRGGDGVPIHPLVPLRGGVGAVAIYITL